MLCVASVATAANGAGSGATPSSAYLSVAGSLRVRYETLDGAFRRTGAGSDQALVSRALVAIETGIDGVFAGAELEDSRAYLVDSGTPLGTDDVNVLEPLQAYLGYRRPGAADGAGRFEVRAGRLTMDIGSRRLVARNRFRNTLTAFSGGHLDWQLDRRSEVQAFLTTPVRRRPLDPRALRDNERSLDDEDFDDLFWGVHLSRSDWLAGFDTQGYLLGLRDHGADRRELYTLGVRTFTADAGRPWQFEVEAAWQWGTSRDLAVAPLRDLDHGAGFLHLEIGRGLATASRLTLLADAVSGDRDPDDAHNGGFDTLFGARRFEFGPTGIYGLLARSNLLSPGLRFATGRGPVQFDATYRAAFLASDRDGLIGALLRDVEGESGDFVGHQIELRLRYAPGAGNLQFEAGGAYLDQGRFVEQAPGAVGDGSTRYGYLQVELKF